MRYKTEIEINAPVEKIAGLLSNHEQMKKWLRELESYETVEGRPMEEGAKTLLMINVAGGMEVTETVLQVDFPTLLVTQYEMQGGTFIANSRLERLSEEETRYILEHEFEFSGPLKMITALMRSAFIRHSERIMNDVKSLAENET